MYLIIKFIIFLLIAGCNPALAQMVQGQDVLPSTNSQIDTTVLNNQLRQDQNAINAIGGYFNSNQQLNPASGGTGTNITTFPNGSLLVYSAANVGIGTINPGTSGQVLTSQGAGVNPIFANTINSFVPNNIQVFTTSGTWVRPANINQVYVKVAGAGATGGNSATAVGGGGGGGGYSEGISGVSGNITVGIGTINSFQGNVIIQATSGTTGTNASGSTPGTGGGGGIGTGGSINITGGIGYVGGLSGSQGGQGGSNLLCGAPGQPGAGTGHNGGTYGCGGGGGGGTGDAGAVIVYY